MSLRDRLLEPEGLFRSALFRDLLHTHFNRDDLKPDDRVGAYRIVRELGRGGMGVVYFAERADGEFEQDVALKWLPDATLAPESAALFRRERQFLAELSHPNIARLIDGGRTEAGHLWFAMECVEGLPIDRHAQAYALGERERVALMVPVVEAVEFAHSRLLIHRDIKPGNVLIDPQGRPKLLDFGIAGLAQESDQTPAFTPEYASPEQRAMQSVGTASDVWQLGKLLESVLTIGRAQPLPRDLRAIIDRATADDSSGRYATATALKYDLQRFLAHRPVRARNGGMIYRISRMAQRHPFSTTGTALGVLALVSLIVGFLWYAAMERSHLRQARDETAAINQFLNKDVIGANDPFYGGASEASVPDILESSLDKVDQRFGGHPAIAGEIDRTLGDALLSRGRYDAARLAADRAIARLTLAHGPLALATGEARLLRAQVDVHLGNAETARKQLLRLQTDFPAGKPGAAKIAWDIKSTLGWNAVQRNRFAECNDIYAAILSDARHIEVAKKSDALNSISLCQSMLGRYTAALQTARQAETLAIRSSGVDSGLTSLARTRISTAMTGLGRHREATTIMLHEVGNLTRLLGPNHNTTLTYASQLGAAHLCAGETTLARYWLGRASGGRERMLGEEHPWTIISQSQYAIALLRDGDIATAARLFQSLEKRLPGMNESLSQVWAARALGEWSLRQGRYEAATSYYRSAHAIASQPDMRIRANLYAVEAGLGLSLSQAGKKKEAAAVFARMDADRRYDTHCTSALTQEAEADRIRLLEAAARATSSPDDRAPGERAAHT